MASISPGKCRSPRVRECLCRCAHSRVPARSRLTLSQHPWEMVISLPHLSDPGRMGHPWVELPRAEPCLSRPIALGLCGRGIPARG